MKGIKVRISLMIMILLISQSTGCFKQPVEEPPVIEDKQANTNPGIIEEKKVDELIIHKTSLVYESGISKLITEVKNNAEEELYVGSFDIIFSDIEGKEIVTLLGYIGDNIKGGESKVLVTSIEQDLRDAVDIEFVLK